MNNRVNNCMESKKQIEDIFELIGKYRKQIMGFAAISILLFHWHKCIFPENTVFYEIETIIKGIGFFGVDIFMLLSGIGLTYSIHKSNLGVFYYKRVKRLLVPFVCVGIVRGVFDHLSLLDILANITGINFWITNIFSLLWFVPAIATLYFLFPLYYKLFERARNKILFTAVVICIWLLVSMLLANFFINIERSDFYTFINRIPVFIIGVMFGWVAQNRAVVISRMGWLFILLFNIIGLYLVIQTTYNNWQLFVPTPNCFFPTLALAISLTFSLAKLSEVLNRFRIGRVIIYIFGLFGTVSLELYCIQGAIAFLLFKFTLGMPNIIVNILNIVVVLIVSYILFFIQKTFWKCIEKRKFCFNPFSK